jgi:hypothetical protein
MKQRGKYEVIQLVLVSLGYLLVGVLSGVQKNFTISLLQSSVCCELGFLLVAPVALRASREVCLTLATGSKYY